MILIVQYYCRSVALGRGRTDIYGSLIQCFTIKLQGFRIVSLFLVIMLSVCWLYLTVAVNLQIVVCTGRDSVRLPPLCTRRTCQRFCLFRYFIASDYVSLQHSKSVFRACRFTLCPTRGTVATDLSALFGQGGLVDIPAIGEPL